ncbi:hypothetical protein [Methanomethylovorans sp.]|uniref:hypothetical protein n=1 Tax=Methanomethylovorans sp. TaxID=2758717 RepID=UPI00351CB4B9
MQKGVSCSGCKRALKKQLLRPRRFHACPGCGHHIFSDFSRKEQSMIRDRSLRMVLRRLHKLNATIT